MKDKEKQIEEILKLDILDCAGIKLAYLDDMRISKSKPLSVMKNMLSIDCHKDYILEALGITKDSVVLSKEEYEELLKVNKADLAEQANYTRKETAEKFYDKICTNTCVFTTPPNVSEDYNKGYVQAMADHSERVDQVAKQFGVEIKE